MYYALGNVYAPEAGWETPLRFSGYWAVISGPHASYRTARQSGKAAVLNQAWPGKQGDEEIRCPVVASESLLKSMGISPIMLTNPAYDNQEARKWLEHITRQND